MNAESCQKWPLITVALLGLSGPAQGLPWDKDMYDQPSIKPQETTASVAASSVTVTSDAPMPVPATTTELIRARIAASKLPNPVPASPQSLEKGHFFYQIYCQVCHGERGLGDGPVGKKFIPPPMDLSLPYVQRQSDGQLFYTISHGSVVMPYYRDAMSVEERWHLVNYLKGALIRP